VDLAVFDFERAIIYANDKTALGSDLGRHLSSAGLSGAVDELLKTGRVANHSSDLEKNAVPYLAGVADEVRTLAQRAAAAAKNTEALIAKTVAKAQEGWAALGRTNAAQTKADAGLGKTGQLITEISAAIHEQSQWIEELDRAVGEIDKVVQQNAAGAEDSAAASEHLKAQADQSRFLAGNLARVVNGAKHNNQRFRNSDNLPIRVRKKPSVTNCKRGSFWVLKPPGSPWLG